jgi:hypothetical protein
MPVASDAEEDVSDASLEYDENAALEESDGSGSEYQKSDDDASVLSENISEDELELKPRVSPRKRGAIRATSEDSREEDDLMTAAAIQASMETGTADSDAVQNVRKLMADAAMARAARGTHPPDSDEAEFSELSSEEEPISSKVKGKGKAKAKVPKKKKQANDMQDGDDKFMTLGDLKKKRAAERRGKNEKRKVLREEERQMRMELGRALTQVRDITVLDFHAV